MQQVSIGWMTADYEPVIRWRIAAKEGTLPSELVDVVEGLMTQAAWNGWVAILETTIGTRRPAADVGDQVWVSTQQGLEARYRVTEVGLGITLEEIPATAKVRA